MSASPPVSIRIGSRAWLIAALRVVLAAGRLGRQDPGRLRARACRPLSLLPAFPGPLPSATHVVIFIPVRRENAAARAAA